VFEPYYIKIKYIMYKIQD